jgi:hypothetical protein
VQGAVQVASGRAASWSSNELILWDTDENCIVAQSIAHEEPIQGIVKLGREVFVTWGGDSIIRVWNTGIGELVREVSGHTGAVTSLHALHDGFVSTSQDGTLRVWSREGESCMSVSRPANGDGLDGSCLTIDGPLLAWSHNQLCVCDLDAGTVRIVDAGTDQGHGYESMKGRSWPIRGARAISNNNWIVTCSHSVEESLKLWDAQTLSLSECFWLESGDRALDVFAESASGIALRDVWACEDAPTISFWVRGADAVYRFEVPQAPELGHAPEILHQRSCSAYLLRRERRGVINGAEKLVSGEIVTHSLTEAAIWRPEKGRFWRAENFSVNNSGDINALVMLDDDSCAIATGQLVSVWCLDNQVKAEDC